MNPRIKKLFTNWRVILLLSLLLFAVIAIHPSPYVKGVAIRNIVRNSSASLAGMENPNPTSSLMSRERVIAVNNIPVNSVAEYYAAVTDLRVGQILTILTNKGSYPLTAKAKTKTVVLNETVNQTITEPYQENINGTLANRTRTRIVEVPKTETLYLGVEDLGLNVYPAPKTNIRKGLDLQGGTRVLLQPEAKLSQDAMDLLIANMKQRLNVFGLSDIVIRGANDLSGNQYIVVEIAGINEEEVKDLLAKQGKFEAKVGNTTVFRGGENDITYVCRSSDCAGIDPQQGCAPVQDGYGCRFRFSIALKPVAAARQANVTGRLKVVSRDESGQLLSKDNQFLNETLNLFLDDQNVDTLNIGADLKGRAVTDIAISGSGLGATEQEALYNALDNMKRLQTILVTGSLPVKLSIVKADALSPVLGQTFVNNSLLVGIAAIFAVAVVIFIRYRKIQVSIPVMFFMLSELVLLLGMASLIGWNLDLAAIAGIIIAIGSGVDHAIVITDELLGGERERYTNWRQRFKTAFFIIMSSYFTVVVAMLPLYRAGAGMLKGFAITTILGLSFGVFITRPAFAAIIETLLKEE
jgi:preprotein translocase subunit SecD